ncbi:hypothetical protein KCX83_00625 [Brucella oryzae]|uniref:hypothetical protein n=1 Tax=Brucella oryzae TaxID=335286 RepID=UPI001B812F8A|nr:hypothetical protein [Brucella oryzae]MBR7650821.1 hypothetical protein [Brucella oryzae]
MSLSTYKAIIHNIETQYCLFSQPDESSNDIAISRYDDTLRDGFIWEISYLVLDKVMTGHIRHVSKNKYIEGVAVNETTNDYPIKLGNADIMSSGLFYFNPYYDINKIIHVYEFPGAGTNCFLSARKTGFKLAHLSREPLPANTTDTWTIELIVD